MSATWHLIRLVEFHLNWAALHNYTLLCLVLQLILNKLVNNYTDILIMRKRYFFKIHVYVCVVSKIKKRYSAFFVYIAIWFIYIYTVFMGKRHIPIIIYIWSLDRPAFTGCVFVLYIIESLHYCYCVTTQDKLLTNWHIFVHLTICNHNTVKRVSSLRFVKYKTK